MAKKKEKEDEEAKLSRRQIKNIKKAFMKNKQAIKKRFKRFREDKLTVAELERQVLQLNGQLRDWLLSSGGEDPKGAEGGRP